MTPEISLPKEAKKIYSYDTLTAVSYTHLEEPKKVETTKHIAIEG